MLSLPPDTDVFWGLVFAVKSLALLSYLGAGTKPWCGTLWGCEDKGRLCLMGFLGHSAAKEVTRRRGWEQER